MARADRLRQSVHTIECNDMSQLDLLGVDSYRDTRRVVRAKPQARQQLALFSLRESVQAPIPARFKRGQQFRVQRTGRVVTFVRYVGRDSLWLCEGETYRATPALLLASRLRHIL